VEGCKQAYPKKGEKRGKEERTQESGEIGKLSLFPGVML